MPVGMASLPAAASPQHTSSATAFQLPLLVLGHVWVQLSQRDRHNLLASCRALRHTILASMVQHASWPSCCCEERLLPGPRGCQQRCSCSQQHDVDQQETHSWACGGSRCSLMQPTAHRVARCYGTGQQPDMLPARRAPHVCFLQQCKQLKSITVGEHPQHAACLQGHSTRGTSVQGPHDKRPTKHKLSAIYTSPGSCYEGHGYVVSHCILPVGLGQLQHLQELHIVASLLDAGKSSKRDPAWQASAGTTDTDSRGACPCNNGATPCSSNLASVLQSLPQLKAVTLPVPVNPGQASVQLSALASLTGLQSLTFLSAESAWMQPSVLHAAMQCIPQLQMLQSLCMPSAVLAGPWDMSAVAQLPYLQELTLGGIGFGVTGLWQSSLGRKKDSPAKPGRSAQSNGGNNVYPAGPSMRCKQHADTVKRQCEGIPQLLSVRHLSLEGSAGHYALPAWLPAHFPQVQRLSLWYDVGHTACRISPQALAQATQHVKQLSLRVSAPPWAVSQVHVQGLWELLTGRNVQHVVLCMPPGLKRERPAWAPAGCSLCSCMTAQHALSGHSGQAFGYGSGGMGGYGLTPWS